MKKVVLGLLVLLLLPVLFSCSGEAAGAPPTPTPTPVLTITPTPSSSPSPTPTATPLANPDFRNVAWGMTRAEVLAIEKEGRYLAQSGNQLLYDDLKVEGLDTLLSYNFNIEGKLYSAGYRFQQQHSNPTIYIYDYNNVKDKLIETYGAPSSDKIVWADDLWKDDPNNWGMAVITGYLIYLAEWQTEATEIALFLSGDNYEVTNFGLVYTSRIVPSSTPAPSPTPTLTPTRTPIPAATPTPGPTPTQAAGESLSSSSYRDDSGYFHIVGEVSNGGYANVEYVKIVATYYDQQENVIGTDYTYSELDILVPGQKSPFDLSSYPDKLPSLKQYRIQVSYRTTTDEPLSGLTVVSHTAKTDTYGYYEIVGEVKNTSGTTAEYVKIVATYYDSGGTVIGTEYTYTSLDQLAVGQTSPFTMSSYPRKIQPTNYSLQVQGRAVK